MRAGGRTFFLTEKELKENHSIKAAGRTGGKGHTRSIGCHLPRGNRGGRGRAGIVLAVVVMWGCGWKIGSVPTGTEVTQTAVGLRKGMGGREVGTRGKGREDIQLDQQDIAVAA